jgi:hypothetical protein
LVLAGSGLPAWWQGGGVGGWPLLAHMTAGGVFLTALLWVALRGAVVHARRPESAATVAIADVSPAARACFWVALAAGWGSAATMFAAMLPWFGQDGQEQLLGLHAASGIALLAALLGYAASRLLSGGSGRN